MNQLDVLKVFEIVEICDNDVTTVTNNACQGIKFSDLVIDRNVMDKINFTFSKSLDDLDPMSQKQAEICWMCGSMSMCRRKMIKKLKLGDDFNLSINYLFFWDKLEKCNYFMDYVIKNINLNCYSEEIRDAMIDPCSDGGYWNYFVDLIKKYGIVPDSVSKRRFSSKNTSCLNKLLSYKLREFAAELSSENLRDPDKNPDIQRIKERYLNVIIRIMVGMLGRPMFPNSLFDWVYCDRDDNNKIIKNLTPLLFYKDYCGINFDNFVQIINDPRPRHPFYRTYTKEDNFNVVAMSKIPDQPLLMLNLPNNDIIKLIKKQIDNGIPVWFTCDIDKYVDHKTNIMNTKIFDFETPFNTSFSNMDKADSMDFRDTYGSHAMVIVGYDLAESNIISKKRKKGEILDKITKFKVENSWGKYGNKNGYYLMDIEWFKMYCFEIVIEKSLLTRKQKKIMSMPPIKLNKNDVLGKILNSNFTYLQ